MRRDLVALVAFRGDRQCKPRIVMVLASPRKATSRDKADLVLPPPETKRWSSRRKAAILVGVRTGVLTREEACQRYLLSEEEFASWEAAFDRAGIPGLRVQSYRRRFFHSND
jgi:hypothetical protein